MNSELENIWEEVVVAWLRYCPAICVEVLRKTMKYLSQHGQCPNWDSGILECVLNKQFYAADSLEDWVGVS
jgi:hypothetical protein